ncbi:MAG: type II secretion system protein [Nitrospinaceae bacterium]|nr:type II secretion system protein [Gammaproteobacteria bacterium]
MVKKQRGFTLVELLVVVAILAILFLAVWPTYLDSKCKAQRSGITAAIAACTTTQTMLTLGGTPTLTPAQTASMTTCVNTAMKTIKCAAMAGKWWVTTKVVVKPLWLTFKAQYDPLQEANPALPVALADPTLYTGPC